MILENKLNLRMLHPKAVGYEKTNIYLFLTPINKLMK